MFLVSGRLSDLFGRRWFFIGGNVICLIGLIVGACAKNMDTLIVASAVYGLGECIQLSFGVAIGELVKNKHRPVVVSRSLAAPHRSKLTMADVVHLRDISAHCHLWT